MKIVYETNTGSSQRYAQMLADKLGCVCESLAKAQQDGEEVIFIGWVMAGTVQGYTAAKEKFGSLKAVCAVGMMATEKQKDELKQKNSVSEELFLLPGAFDIKKLSGMYKMMMGMMMKMLKGNLKNSEDPAEKKALAMFEEGFDAVSEEHLEEVYQWLGV